MKRRFFFILSALLTFIIGSLLVSGFRAIDDLKSHVSKFDSRSVEAVEIAETKLPILPLGTPPEFDPTIDYAKDLRVKLLQTGEFHAEEVPYRTGEKWLGLFRIGDRYFLRHTKVKNEIIEEEGLYDRRITTTAPYESVLLLKNAERLETGEVINVFDSKTDDYKIERCDAQPKSFGMKGQFWWLCLENASPEGFTQKGTALILRRSGFDSQVLRYLPEGCNDCGWSVSWVGDLDRDNELDFMIDLSGHYNSYEPTLFLSSASRKVGLIAIFAGYRGIGC